MENDTIIVEIGDGGILSVKSNVKNLKLVIIDHDFEESQVTRLDSEYVASDDVEDAILQIIEGS